VFQFYALYPHMSVEANVEFPLRCARVPASERRAAVARVAERLGLEPLLQRRPRELSRRGPAARRARARWFAAGAVADGRAARNGSTPTAAARCASSRSQQLEQKVTTVYVTHDQDEACGSPTASW
jgi:multiple sugar transport system ATP-binding protein